MQKIEQIQEIETLTIGTSGTERPVSEVIGGALVRVALALVIIVSLLFISSPRKSEAFTLSGILREVAREGAVDKARNTPSQAFIALLQAAYVSTGVEINGPTIIRAWQAAYRPRMGAYYAMEEAYTRVMRACGIKDYDCVEVMGERQITLDPDFLKSLFRQGMVMVAFFGSQEDENAARARSASSALNLFGLYGFGNLVRADQYRIVETALAVIGMTEAGDAVVLDGKGQPAALKIKDLETCKYIMGVMGVNQHDRSNLNGEKIAALVGVSAAGEGEKPTKRESKVSAESEDYLNKIRNEIN